MATPAPVARRATAAPPPDDSPALTWLTTWIRGHRQITAGLVVALVVGGGLLWWNAISKNRTEAIASERLSQARLAFESRNYPLAGSELSQVVENYSGTRAAQEAELLLAEARMLQGQGQQAIDLLKRFALRGRALPGTVLWSPRSGVREFRSLSERRSVRLAPPAQFRF